MFGLRAPELIIILVIILVLFGGSKLPKLARSLGSSAHELRKGLKGEDDTKTTEQQQTPTDTPKQG